MKIITSFWRWWYTKVHRSSSKYTRPEALAIARKYGLEYEVIMAMDYGYTPDEALQEWDIFPFEEQKKPGCKDNLTGKRCCTPDR